MSLLMSKTIVSSLNPIFHLPEDLIIEILSRLPVKSLVRFSVVCKAWKVLIENPIFISKHLKQNHNLNFSYLRVSYTKHKNPNIWCYDAMSLYSGNALDTIINLDFPFLGQRINLYVIGACNGLVCISWNFYAFDLVICNPSTRRFTKIPSFETPEGNFLLDREAAYGFAFDPFSDDYKVICIKSYFGSGRKGKAGVYTMSTNSWREIDTDVPIDNNLRMREHLNAVPVLIGNVFECVVGPPALLDGVFYWECSVGPPSYNALVLSFNMTDESFRVIPGPEGFNGMWGDAYWKCVQLKEEIAVFAFTSGRCFDVWTLNADLVSWKLKYAIETMPVVVMPLGLNEVGVIRLVGRGKNGDVIYEDRTSSDTQLFFYDLDSGEIKRLPFVDIEGHCEVLGYTESLIPVKKNEV